MVEAPNRNAIIKIHDLTHGEIPHQVIELDASIVESFLGRIEDPEKALSTDLNIINDPAFIILMVMNIENHSFNNYKPFAYNLNKLNVYSQMIAIVKSFEGNVVQQNDNGFLI